MTSDVPSSSSCQSCGAKKLAFSCGRCQSNLCKPCTQDLKKDSFPLLDPVPDDLTHRKYCGRCFLEVVQPQLDTYTDLVERARGVIVFLKKKSEETRLLNRSEKTVRVTNCADESEAMLKLAMVAVRGNFNALLDVTFTSKSIRNFGYQTSRCEASGVPTNIEPDKLDRLEGAPWPMRG